MAERIAILYITSLKNKEGRLSTPHKPFADPGVRVSCKA